MLIRDSEKVFLNLDHFIEFVNVLAASKQNGKLFNKFILVTHNSDQCFTEKHFNLIKDYVHKIYALNCVISKSPQICKIPLGFVDNKYKPHQTFVDIKNLKLEKDILLYMNFSINTNPIKRNECFDTFKGKSWVLSNSGLPPADFYKHLAHSKYVLSPEGTGIDCHRIYESIFLGAIPIVKTCLLDDLYEKLPLVTVKKWTDVNQRMVGRKL